MNDLETIIKMVEMSTRHSVGPMRGDWPPEATHVLRLWDRNQKPMGFWYFDKDGQFITALAEERK